MVGEPVAARWWCDAGGLLVFAVVPASWDAEGVLGVLGGGSWEVGVALVGFEWARFAGVRDGRDGSGLVLP